ncbi:MAG TPA: hypothetical protein VGK77_18300 [Candidatus Binatia bacterium]|jgi:uncharacterized membrane protein
MTADSRLRAAQERRARFKIEIAASDAATAAYLTAAWKEQIIGALVSLLQVTDDPTVLGLVDGYLALMRDEVDDEKISDLANSG